MIDISSAIGHSKPRDTYASDKRDTFKRPINNDYPKRVDPLPRSNTYDSRNVLPAAKDRYGGGSHGISTTVSSSDGRSGGSSFVSGGRGGGSGGGRGDDRLDVR